MSSSGDDGGGGYFPGMAGAASPMPGLPVAGKDNVVGDPYKYGKFQQFLPDDLIHETGRNDNATGLRPDMFRYRGPGGEVDGGSASDTNGQIQGLRDQLAQLQASQNSGGGGAGAGWTNGVSNMPQGMMSSGPYGGLSMSDFNTFAGHVGMDAANKWASQQMMRTPTPPTYQESYGGGFGGGAGDGSP